MTIIILHFDHQRLWSYTLLCKRTHPLVYNPFIWVAVYRLLSEASEGYFFTGICLFNRGRGRGRGCLDHLPPPGQHLYPWTTPTPGQHLPPPPSGQHPAPHPQTTPAPGQHLPPHHTHNHTPNPPHPPEVENKPIRSTSGQYAS